MAIFQRWNSEAATGVAKGVGSPATAGLFKYRKPRAKMLDAGLPLAR